jgi:Zn-finger nucleic acid-binding protein
MSERQGVEIDYCPTCRGIWLDRGELDKLLDRADHHHAAPQSQPSPAYPPNAPPPPSPYSHQPPPPPYGYRPDLDDSKHGYKYKKPKSWWHEIFD